MNHTRGVTKTTWKLLCSINRLKGFSPVAPTIVNKNKGFLLLRLACRTAWEQALFIYLAFFCVLPAGGGGGGGGRAAGRGKSSILLPPCPCRRWKNAEKNLSLFWRLLEIESLYCVISSYSVTLSKNSPTIPKDKGWSLISKLPNFPHPTLPWMRQRLNNVAKMKTLSPVSASHSCSHLI